MAYKAYVTELKNVRKHPKILLNLISQIFGQKQ